MPFPNHSHFIELPATAAQIPEDRSGALVFFDLRNAPSDFWTNIGTTDGADIIVSSADGLTEYPRYPLFIDTVLEKGVIAARVDNLVAATGTTYRLYYGYASATMLPVTDPMGRNAVFQDYDLALNCTKVVNTDELEDMTGNGRTGTLLGASALSETGHWGRSIATASVGDGISLTEVVDEEYADPVQSFTALLTKTSAGTSNEDPFGWSNQSGIRLNVSGWQLRHIGNTYWRTSVIPQNVSQVFGVNLNESTDISTAYLQGTEDDQDTGVTAEFSSGPNTTPKFLSQGIGSNSFVGTGSILLIVFGSERTANEFLLEANTILDAGFWTWPASSTANPDAGGTAFSVQGADSSHAHDSDALETACVKLFTVNGAPSAHAHDSDSLEATAVFPPVFTVGGTDSSHGHESDSLNISFAGVHSVQGADSTHVHTSDSLESSLVLPPSFAVQGADSTHAHDSDPLAISVQPAANFSVQGADSTHAHESDAMEASIFIAQVFTVNGAPSLHAHESDSLHAQLTETPAVPAPCYVRRERVFYVTRCNKC